MSILEGIMLALTAIAANKLRSILTLLGVIIGVAAVVAMMSLGAGAQESVTAEFQTIGTNLVFVQPRFDDEEHAPANLKPRDLRALEAGADYLTDLTPFSSMVAEMRQGQHRLRSTVAGTGEHFLDVQNLGLASGRFFSQREVILGARVCVLGPQVKQELFGERDALGKTFRLNNQIFTVIGVMDKKAERSFISDGLTGDSISYIPINTLQRMTGLDELPFVMGLPLKPDLIQGAVDQVKAVIARLYGPKHGFQIGSTADMLDSINRVVGIFTVVLGCLGGISLLVGGIGVMNVMLVAVTERTREIGLHRAVGAKRRHIMLQFIVEAVTLTVCGGLLGVIGGSAFAGLIGLLTPLHTAVTWPAVFTAFGCVGAIGVLFGLYPAYRAAYLDPIEALRYE